MLKSQMKKMLITFLNINPIVVQFEFIPQSQRVILICEAVRRKMPKILPNDWILHHDNAAAHKVLYQAVSGTKI